MKKDKIELYKKEQFKIEKDKKKIEDIIDSLIADDIFTPEQLKKLGITNVNDTVEVDMKVLEKELRAQIGDGVFSQTDKYEDEKEDKHDKESESESESESNSEPESSSDEPESESSSSESESEEEVKPVPTPTRTRVKIGKKRIV